MTPPPSPVDTAVDSLSQRLTTLEQPLDTPADLDPLLDEIGDARYVLLGEASHGTADYYLWRARLSQRLITEKGFSFIPVEGDWPDCYQINRSTPQQEAGNYVPTVLPDQYDAFLFIGKTEALHPPHLEPAGTTPPETFPRGV